MLERAANPLLIAAVGDPQGEVKRRTTLVSKSAKRKIVSALQSKNAVAEIRELPPLEHSLHIICRGNFPLWSIVPAILDLEAPATITELAIATLGFSNSNATDLLAHLDRGQIKSVSLVASCYFQRQSPEPWNIMADGLRSRGHKIAAIRSHAKVIALALSNGKRFAVESSANLRSCGNIEQITITRADDLYGFHRQWINSVIAAATR